MESVTRDGGRSEAPCKLKWSWIVARTSKSLSYLTPKTRLPARDVFNLDFNLEFNLDLNLNFNLDLNLYFNLDLNLDFNLDLNLDFNLDFNLAGGGKGDEGGAYLI